MKLWNIMGTGLSFMFFAIAVSVGTVLVGQEISESTLLIIAVYWLLFWLIPKLSGVENIKFTVIIGILTLVFLSFNFIVKQLLISNIYEIFMIFFALLFFAIHYKIITNERSGDEINEFWYHKILIAYNESYTLLLWLFILLFIIILHHTKFKNRKG